MNASQSKQNRPSQRTFSTSAGRDTPAHSIRHHANPVLNLQRTIGNQAVQRLLQASPNSREEGLAVGRESGSAPAFAGIPVSAAPTRTIQTKLTVNAPGDAYEQEADRAAEQVMRMSEPGAAAAPTSSPGPGIQRACACGGTCDDCRQKHPEDEHAHVQMKATGPASTGGTEAPPIVHDVLRSPGQPLDSATRAFMEPRFGQDFSGVRVHADAQAAESASAVQARAYTVGQDIVFGAGEFAPGVEAGGRLLGHELAHVVQQGIASDHSAQLQRKATPDDEKKKIEAVKKHKEQQQNVAKLLSDERTMATTTSRDALDPHNVYRNTVELLDNKKIRLVLLTPTHYSTPDKPVYFDLRVAYERIDGDYPADPDATNVPGIDRPSPGSVGATPKVIQTPGIQPMPPKVEGGDPAKSPPPAAPPAPPTWSAADIKLYLPTSLVTKDELRDAFIHEGQHAADWAHLRSATLGDWKTMLEEYKSEFRAHWLQPGFTMMSDDPLRSAENPVILQSNRQCTGCPTPAPSPGGTPPAPRTMATHLKNKKQAAIFWKLINEYVDDQFDCFYVCNQGFRDAVDAFDHPEGENLVNSSRLVDLHIEVQKLTQVMSRAEVNATNFVAATEALDDIDWEFLTQTLPDRKKRLSGPFWTLLEQFAPKPIVDALKAVKKKADVHEALIKALAKLK